MAPKSAKGTTAEQSAQAIAELLAKGKRSKMPKEIKPMLATLVNAPFDDPDWIYEVKWDGYRTIAFVDNGVVDLRSRNGKSFTEKFYPIASILEKWNMKVVLDGEIMVLDKNGQANFGALQNWRSESDGDLVFYAFDILWYDGKDVTQLPLWQRLELLRAILPTSDDRVRISKSFTTNGVDFFDAAREMKLEGIMAKKRESTYRQDNRTKDWVKIKVSQRQEVVIGGYTKNEGSNKPFSSLLLGVFDKGKLQYVGKVGTGFSAALQKQMLEQFSRLVTTKMPFESEPDINKPSRFRPDPPKAAATWLKPELVCEVSYAEITSDGVFRHPSFQGMRSDKNAKDVVLEVAPDTTNIESDMPKKIKSAKKDGIVSAPKASESKTLLNPSEETQVKKVNGHNLKFSNLSKLYWPEDGYSKRDLFNYYYQISDFILPHLKNRPLSLNRFPNGIHGMSFYQKDVKGKAPDWAETFPYTTSDGEEKEYLVGKDEATLLWMVSLGCIEINPWFSTVQHPDNPDYCVIDLDPDKNTFDQVVEVALEVKNVLDAIGVAGYAKTSGSTGMHIYIPLGAKHSYDQSQLFAKLLVTIVHQKFPEFTSMERQIKNRDGKMYLDFLQNRPGATIAGPYSLRPKPGATVSMPLHWDEIKKGLKMSDFTIANAVARARSEGDLFAGVLSDGIDMQQALENAHKLL